MTISILRLYSRRSVLSYQRRFPVVYFTYPAMRRPRFVNKQLEVYAFLCVYIPIANKLTTILTLQTQTIMRKLFSVLSSTLPGGVSGGLLLLLLVASMSVIYASDTQVDGIWYDFDSSTKTASVTYRGSYCFSYEGEYSGSVVIPETVTYNGTTYSVTSIGEEAFYYCTSLTSVTIPNSVTSIGKYAFDDCTSLTSITIPNSVTSIGDNAFEDCSSFTSVTIPNSVTSIGEGTFFICTSLTSITIPNSVTTIGNYAFSSCRSLTSITIPNSVTSIGGETFNGCSSLKTVICEAVEVPELGVRVFRYMPLSEATLYVPAQSLDDYKAADQWKEFGTILPSEDTPSSVENIPSTTTNCQKIIRDGHLVIIRDGVEYNVMGQQL